MNSKRLKLFVPHLYSAKELILKFDLVRWMYPSGIDFAISKGKSMEEIACRQFQNESIYALALNLF